MKRLLVALVVLFTSFNFIACSQKKESKTRLTRGAPRESQIAGTASANGWNILNSYSEQAELISQNPDATARAFIGDVLDGPSQINTVQLYLKFNSNGQINSQYSRIGFKFYDNWNNPMPYYVGPENAKVQGQRIGNEIDVTFTDAGTVRVVGTINGSTFSGRIFFDGNGDLGRFDVTTNYSIFY